MAARLTGGCACGAVRYECTADPVMSANCYCRDCQRAGGGAFASVLAVPKEALKLTGQLKHHEVKTDSGNKMSRGFCPNCGSPILALPSAEPHLAAINTGSLDDPSQFHPAANIYTSSSQPWAPMSPDLPKFPKMPG
jgi:hypothetical protein